LQFVGEKKNLDFIKVHGTTIKKQVNIFYNTNCHSHLIISDNIAEILFIV